MEEESIMKAAEAIFQKLLDGKLQYRVPLFQRTYSWEEENWQRLWDDILEVYALVKSGEPRSHFMGAIVTLPFPDAPQLANKFMLIDGQQRLTTFFILLASIRDAAEEKKNDPTLSDEIDEGCLINKFAGIPEEREKLRPTQQDVDSFKTVVSGQEPDSSSRVGLAYRFFLGVLRKGDLNGEELNLRDLKSCITDYLSLVSITLDQADSPHRIFESLNNTGMALSASDLIRNDIFMRLVSEAEQDEIYRDYWQSMQQRMEYDDGKSVLSSFFWRYLMKDGGLPRYDEVFEAMRRRIDSRVGDGTSIRDILAELDLFSEYYVKLWRPASNEMNQSICEQLQRLNQWEVDAAYPFMLNALHRRRTKVIDDHQLLEVLGMIESFVVRRVVCGIPTNRLRRVFARMSLQTKDDDYVESCRHFLMNNDWPTDKRFHEMFEISRIYISSRLSRTRLILTSLEQSYDHHEQIAMTDKITIEHIMPQELNAEWREQLGSNAPEVHDKYLHTIGNLTYSGYNSAMSNSPFATKKNILKDSHFELNRHIVQTENWTETEIQARARELANRALVIWKRDT